MIRSQTDPWLAVDRELVRELRRSLNEAGHQSMPIYYPLIAKSEEFYDPQWRAAMVSHLRGLPVDAIWLRVHPFGTPKAGPLTLKRYLAACRDLHQLETPLVGEHTGSIGVALMAFGALGGVESGITIVDHTDLSDWLRIPSKKGGGGGEARVYLQNLAAFIDRSKARALFERPGMKSAHACLDPTCCRRGWRDTLGNYREHFVHNRAAEVSGLSIVPNNLRAGEYMENFLRPATDRAVRAAEFDPTLEKVRKRLDSWRGTLGSDMTTSAHPTFSPPAAGRRTKICLTTQAKEGTSVASAIALRLDSIKSHAGVRAREIAELLDTTPQTVSRWQQTRGEPQPTKLQQLLALEWLATQLAEFYEPDDARLWLYSPHRLLKGRRPASSSPKATLTQCWRSSTSYETVRTCSGGSQ